MDKRFLIFILSTVVALFLVNSYFEKKGRAGRATPLTPAESTMAQSVPLSQDPELALFSVVELFYEEAEEQHNPIGYGVTLAPNTLLTSFKSVTRRALPIYVQTDPDPFVLLEQELDASSLALYVKQAQKSPQIEMVTLPSKGLYELYILSLTSATDRPQVERVQYEEGSLFFPMTIPSHDGIAFVATERGVYQPVGLYNAQALTLTPFDHIPSIAPFVTSSPFTDHVGSMATEEQFFVLENETVQIVFSSLGGAIAEVNLPFQSDHHPDSVVLPVEVDRAILKQKVQNSRFPLRVASAVEGTQIVSQQPQVGGYYPLFRRGLYLEDGQPLAPIDPRYYGFNIVSDDPETAHLNYQVTHFTEEMIQLEARDTKRRIIKTYRLPKMNEESIPYSLIASVKIEGDAHGLKVTSGVPEVELISGSFTPLLKYSLLQGQNINVEKLSLPKTSTQLGSIQPKWISNSNGYFNLILTPLGKIGNGLEANLIPGGLEPSRLALKNRSRDKSVVDQYPGYELILPLLKSSTPLEFRLYLGPNDQSLLRRLDAIFTDPKTGESPNYIKTKSFHGWFSFISEPFAKFLFLIMDLFFQMTHSWGFSILLLTLVLRVMIYPLNAWSIRSTLKLQEIGPKMNKLQQKYKQDPKRAQIEMMKFYKEHKINPLGGCLPLIIQMPFLFGMFNLLKSTFSLRGASFIPGWIDNLTAPDHLFSWGVSLPFIGSNLHLLPLILGGVMFLQQKLMSSGKKGDQTTAQQKQQQSLGSIMTIVFTFLFYKFPSGLNLYWLFSMLLQIGQQKLTALKMKRKKSHGHSPLSSMEGKKRNR